MTWRKMLIDAWERKAKTGFIVIGKDGARIAISKNGAAEVHPDDARRRVGEWLTRNSR